MSFGSGVEARRRARAAIDSQRRSASKPLDRHSCRRRSVLRPDGPEPPRRCPARDRTSPLSRSSKVPGGRASRGVDRGSGSVLGDGWSSTSFLTTSSVIGIGPPVGFPSPKSHDEARPMSPRPTRDRRLSACSTDIRQSPSNTSTCGISRGDPTRDRAISAYLFAWS